MARPPPGDDEGDEDEDDELNLSSTSWLGHGEKAPHICSNLEKKRDYIDCVCTFIEKRHRTKNSHQMCE